MASHCLSAAGNAGLLKRMLGPRDGTLGALGCRAQGGKMPVKPWTTLHLNAITDHVVRFSSPGALRSESVDEVFGRRHITSAPSVF